MGVRRKRYNKGRWMVQRERCGLSDNQPPASGSLSASIGDIIPTVMKRAGLQEQHWMAEIEENWQELVGADVAAHTRPGKVQGKRLIVFVDNSVWLNELSRYGKKAMQANLTKKFGNNRISSISFQLDPG